MNQSILLVDDDASMLRLLSMRLSAAGYEVSEAENAEQARARLQVSPPRLVISDVRLPDGDGLALFDEIHARHPVLPVILLTAHGSIPDAVAATSRGVFDYLTKPFDGQALLDKVARAFAVAPAGTAEAAPDDFGAGLITRSVPMAELLAQARMAAGSDAAVLIEGDAGTGKELLAGIIHAGSARASGPLVVVDCGAIPEQLLDTELFGPDGLLRAAAGGTLLLDEVDAMPQAVQARLVRALEEGEIRAPGAASGEKIDVRVLATLRMSGEAARGAGRLREDLYYRLKGVRLQVPPLAQRRDDIPLLARHFLAEQAKKQGKTLTNFAPDALEALVTADWPGNVRQLSNVVEQVSALATTPLIPLSLVERALAAPTLQSLSYAEAKRRFERDYLVQLLRLTDGNVSDAAKLADRNRTKFYSLLQRHGLTPSLFRNAARVARTTGPGNGIGAAAAGSTPLPEGFDEQAALARAGAVRKQGADRGTDIDDDDDDGDGGTPGGTPRLTH